MSFNRMIMFRVRELKNKEKKQQEVIDIITDELIQAKNGKSNNFSPFVRRLNTSVAKNKIYSFVKEEVTAIWDKCL